MRLRNIKDKEKILADSSYVVIDPEVYCGKWNKVFNNDNPIYIEIGMGKGQFIRDNALKYPKINFIGIEKYDSVLARAIPKIPKDIDNLRIIRMDALNIDNVFKNEISRIYLNFSDPWPKVRHSMRRLSSEVFLTKYDSIFKSDCQIYMRTDNRDLFIYSLESLSTYGYGLSDVSFDLHSEVALKDLITTEYEDKFSLNGDSIYSLVASKGSDKTRKV